MSDILSLGFFFEPIIKFSILKTIYNKRIYLLKYEEFSSIHIWLGLPEIPFPSPPLPWGNIWFWKNILSLNLWWKLKCQVEKTSVCINTEGRRYQGLHSGGGVHWRSRQQNPLHCTSVLVNPGSTKISRPTLKSSPFWNLLEFTFNPL